MSLCLTHFSGIETVVTFNLSMIKNILLWRSIPFRSLRDVGTVLANVYTCQKVITLDFQSGSNLTINPNNHNS